MRLTCSWWKQLGIPVNQRADIIRRTQRWTLAKAESHSDGFDKEDLSDERVKNKVSNRLSYLIRKKWERDDSLGGERDDDDGDAAVPLSTRAQPLLKLFAAAQQANTYVMWQAVE